MAHSLLEDLVRKTKQKRGTHGYLEELYGKRNKAVVILNVFGSSIISLLAFSDIDILSKILMINSFDILKIILGLIGFVMFIVNVLSQIFNLTEMRMLHRKAVELYSDLLRDIRQAHAHSENNQISQELLEAFNNRYLQTTIAAVPVTISKFEKAEAGDLRHEANRRALRINPFAKYWQLRKLAKEQVEEVKKRQCTL